MKKFIFIILFVFGFSTLAQDDSSESAIQKPTEQLQDSANKIEPRANKGTIQKTSPETKKIVKKIMSRKKKSKTEKEMTTETPPAPTDAQEAPKK